MGPKWVGTFAFVIAQALLQLHTSQQLDQMGHVLRAGQAVGPGVAGSKGQDQVHVGRGHPVRP
jgi:hypothetical protein